MALTHPDSKLPHHGPAPTWRHHALWVVPVAALIALAVWAAVGFNQSQEAQPVLRGPMAQPEVTAPTPAPEFSPAPVSAEPFLNSAPLPAGAPDAQSDPTYTGNPGSAPNPPAVVDRNDPRSAL